MSNCINRAWRDGSVATLYMDGKSHINKGRQLCSLGCYLKHLETVYFYKL